MNNFMKPRGDGEAMIFFAIGIVFSIGAIVFWNFYSIPLAIIGPYCLYQAIEHAYNVK